MTATEFCQKSPFEIKVVKLISGHCRWLQRAKTAQIPFYKSNTLRSPDSNAMGMYSSKKDTAVVTFTFSFSLLFLDQLCMVFTQPIFGKR